MDKNKNLLKQFVNSKSQFLDLKDSEEATVKYLSVEPVVTQFQGNSVNSMRFHFEVDGKELCWDRTSREFAKQMMSFSAGDILLIKVSGQRNKTKYSITKLN